ncbi:class I SAM-dependent methyltransferase [Alteromonas sp. a30]|uniref:class I SAM-dependent methyltransferase n=1 Tax=Alteromonas sp. a30 TaxID=2730917 RepID=UPI003FA35066
MFMLATNVAVADPIVDAVANDARPAQQRLRDEFRHPQQTLRFFGIKPEMTVVEIWPGGGWYSNILAPMLKEKGEYYAAHFYVDADTSAYFANSRKGYEEKVANFAPYKNVKMTTFHPTEMNDIAMEGKADRVLTFRNIHNWYMRQGNEGVEKAFQQFFNALKKGGELGVVEHRLPESAPVAMQKTSGYMKQSYVIQVAQKAGFKLVAESEVNANPRDTADHPKGVWTLLPRLRLGEQDKEKYMAIGESDRMTLRFVKPSDK